MTSREIAFGSAVRAGHAGAGGHAGRAGTVVRRRVALVVALIGIVLLGVMPAPFVDLAQAAVAPLLR